MALQLQWSLDRTVGSALSIAKGVLIAANQDNVQPLAIISCEKFGNTLAMCQDTCRKIESLTARTPPMIAISFIKAYAGFDPADTATQLSKSQAGIQFLGLAAAFVTSLGPFKGGQIIHRMLVNSAADKTLVPGVGQLKDLLARLEPRLTRSAFVDSIIGWQLFLSQSSRVPQEYRSYIGASYDCPNDKGMEDLVEAFRQLSRIGESSVESVTIEAASCSSWIIAFTKWCLGLPPSIQLDSGESVLEQPGSRIQFILIKPSKSIATIKISIHHVIGSPSELIDTQSPLYWNGMASVEEYGRWSLHDLQTDTGTAHTALLEAVPRALERVIRMRLFSQYLWGDSGLGTMNSDLVSFFLSPFPEGYIIARAMSQYLNRSDLGDINLGNSNDTPIVELPAVKAYLDIIEAACPCHRCSTLPRIYFGNCYKDDFVRSISIVCAEVLALSLFGLQNFPLLCIRHDRGLNSFETSIAHIIANEAGQHVAIQDLIDFVLELTGHGHGQDPRWAMSSYKGQVIFPTLYETMCVDRTGYLALIWLPGVLRYNNEVYDKMFRSREDAPAIDAGFHPSLLSSLPDVTQPRMLLHGLQTAWMVKQGDGVLRLSLGLKLVGAEFRTFKYSLYQIFNVLSSTLLLEACEHDADSILSSPDAYATYTTPMYPGPPALSNHSQKPIGVVAVDGSDAMRFFSLCNTS